MLNESSSGGKFNGTDRDFTDEDDVTPPDYRGQQGEGTERVLARRQTIATLLGSKSGKGWPGFGVVPG
jgi:hypothetical protein